MIIYKLHIVLIIVLINSTNENLQLQLRSNVLKGKRKRDEWKTNSSNTRLIVWSLGHLNSL